MAAPPFDVLFTRGRIRTLDPRRPVAHSLGVHQGRVISLDDEVPASMFGRVHDLGGAPVLPGFNDAHLHLTHLGAARLQLDLRPEVCPDLDSLLEAVREGAARAAEGEWVVGAGYNQNDLDGRHPTAEQLDAVSGGHPVWLVHNSRHMGVANTAAFERAGYRGRREVGAPEGGAAPVDEAGRAIGLLEETAKALVTDHIPPSTAADVARMVAMGSELAASVGLTSITEPGLGAPDHIGQSTADLAGYQLARDRGELRTRATVMPYLTVLHDLDPAAYGLDDDGTPMPIGLDLGLRTGLGDEWLRIGPTKLLSDGSLIGRSAFMCCDYAGDAGNHGYLQFEAETMRRRIIGAHRAGWQLAVHAIGDAALDLVMDIVEEAQALLPRPDARHRIEHVSVANDAQLARMARLGLVAVPQGRFITELGDGAQAAMGPDRAGLTYRVKGLLDAGLVLPASTDAPVVAPDPLLNIHDLVNRRTRSGASFGPDERITVDQAVHAYTVGSAHAVHEEHRKGTLAPGMLADFVTLSDDLYAVPVETIRDVTVTSTVVGGRIVHGSL